MPAEDEALDGYIDKVLSIEGMVKEGLLLGFPRNAAEGFSQFGYKFDTWQIPKLMEIGASEDEISFVRAYFEDGGDDTFRKNHSEQLEVLFDKYYPDLLPEGRDYYKTWNGIRIPGFYYISGNPNEDDKKFVAKVKQIFQVSGMSEFVESIKSDSK